MGATSVQASTDKRLYRNNTAGWLGVVVVDHDGKAVGQSVEPYGTVWLSDAEAVLTARAPRRPEDNPFEEQVFVGLTGEGQRQDFVMRPLTLEQGDQRFVPTERYVPIQDLPDGAVPAPRMTQATRETAAPGPPSTGSQAPGQVPPPAPAEAPPASAPAPPQRTVPTAVPVNEEQQSWTAPPEAPGQVLPAALGGSDDVADATAAAEPTNHPSTATGERYVPTAGQAQAAVQTPGAMEETAEAVRPEIGEETGAARPPTQPQPEGEYAQAEEVGSPDAPTRNDDDSTLIGG